MKKELIRLANHLDRIGLVKEASYVDEILKKTANKDRERISPCEAAEEVKKKDGSNEKIKALRAQSALDRKNNLWPSLQDHLDRKTKDYEENGEGYKIVGIPRAPEFDAHIKDQDIKDFMALKKSPYLNLGHMVEYYRDQASLDMFGTTYSELKIQCHEGGW